MNRGRHNGKRHAKRKDKGGFAATRHEVSRVERVADQVTGTNRVVLDNTVPGGYRYEHTPGRAS
jgi:hypothetical protein